MAHRLLPTDSRHPNFATFPRSRKPVVTSGQSARTFVYGIAKRTVHRLAVHGAAVVGRVDRETLVLLAAQLHGGAFTEVLVLERY